MSLQSTITNSFLTDSARNFQTVVGALGAALPDWDFCITGNGIPASRIALPRLRGTGVLESPFELLAGARAMALLSDYGLGFKTKILDAILLRCFVLVTPRLHARLPACLLPYCLVVDPGEPGTFKSALLACERPFPDGDANELLRRDAFAAMDMALDGLESPEDGASRRVGPGENDYLHGRR